MADGDSIADPAPRYQTALRQICDESVGADAVARTALMGVKKELQAYDDEAVRAVLRVEDCLERARHLTRQGLPVSWREAYAEVRDIVTSAQLGKKPMNLGITVAQRMLNRLEYGHEMLSVRGELVENYVQTVYSIGFESHVRVFAAFESSSPAPATLEQRIAEVRRQIGSGLGKFVADILSGCSVKKLRLPPKRKASLDYDADV